MKRHSPEQVRGKKRVVFFSSLSAALLILLFGCKQPNGASVVSAVEEDSAEARETEELVFPVLLADEVAGADGYRLQISTSPDFEEDSIVFDSAEALFESVRMDPNCDFQADILYYWRVLAYKDEVPGSWTEPLTFILTNCGIAPEESLDPVMFADLPLSLSWTGPEWASGYHLQVGASPDFGGSLLLDTTEISSNVYEFAAEFAESLPDGSEYFWRLRARNGDGVWSAWSPVYGSFVPPRLTCSVSGITATRAALTVSSICDGGLVVTEAGLAWGPAGAALETYEKIPSYNQDSSAEITFSSSLTKLAVASAYSARAYAVCCGVTAYGPETDFTTSASYSVGDTGPAGGTVFFVGYYNGWRYLEAAPSDQSSGVVWGGVTETPVFNTSAPIGYGESNTSRITTILSAGSYAARICADLSLGGFDDWFLPSRDELICMYNQKSIIGGFAAVPYWSSFEFIEISASFSDHKIVSQGCAVNFGNGLPWMQYKNMALAVRAIRAF